MEKIKEQLGSYRLKNLLGQGGFAQVFLAEHLYLGTPAAVKVLQIRLTDEILVSFLQEARIIAHLEHPHIVRVLDFGVEEEIPFLVMSYASNGSLRQRCPKGAILSLTTMMSYIKPVASALQYAHDRGLVHRDIKPDNMLLGQQGTVLLSDFGIAVVAEHFDQQRLAVGGTVIYTAPEQLQGKPCFASDQYALGIVVYEWLCGHPPFSGSLLQIALQHLQTAPPSLCEKNAALPAAVEQVVLRALAKEPHQRFASILAFVVALEEACLLHQSSTQTASSSVDKTVKRFPSISKTPAIWNVPHRRNPFFTGREDVLTRLHEVLTAKKAAVVTQVQAITGLGGIGKTQTALEYAYRYARSYQIILWARADTRETLLTDLTALAEALNLPEKDEQYPGRVVAAVKNWLQHNAHWLLILDNVEDFSLLNDILPVSYTGHVLLTTRTQMTGAFARCIDLEQMTAEEGAQFLLRRSKHIPSDGYLEDAVEADRPYALKISRLLDGLPLALDQAGAYMEETACSLSDYLSRYQQRRTELLDMRGGLVYDHPESVTTTFSLSFEKVERQAPAAAELLRLCAFLHPDAIPEDLLTDGAVMLVSELQPVVSDPLNLDSALSTLRTFSLLRRNRETKMLTIHRLVQEVIKMQMDEGTQRKFAEQAIQLINRAFPGYPLFGMNSHTSLSEHRIQLLLDHALICAELIKQWNIVSLEGASLLDHAGVCLRERIQFLLAERFFLRALGLREQMLEGEHNEIATSLFNLALLYATMGKYAQAEPLLIRAMSIFQRTLGSMHSGIAACLLLHGEILIMLGKYNRASSLTFQALDIYKQLPDAESHLHISECLNNLGFIFHQQGKYAQAEQCLQQGLALLSSKNVNALLPYLYCNLAMVYGDWGRYEQAEAIFHKAQVLCEGHYGKEDPCMGGILGEQARLCYYQGQYAKGVRLCQQALAIWEQTIGAEPSYMTKAYHQLGMLYKAQSRYTEAEHYYKKALSIREQALGSEHEKTANTQHYLGRLYFAQQKYDQAELLFLQAMRIYKLSLGLEHPYVAQVLHDQATLYLVKGEYTRAGELYQKAFTIGKHVLGPEHPEVVRIINSMGKLLYLLKECTEAETSFRFALALREKVLGSKHPDVAESLNELGRLYYDQSKYTQAEALYQSALAIREQTLGIEHPDSVVVLKNYALLLFAMGDKERAEGFVTRIKTIQENSNFNVTGAPLENQAS